ncbi:MAG: NAD(P)-binding domain-containing protein [Candidatus Diapherotrites archaeon]|nr:NAD(P)-binding domain-containing protein [Candidatus Diapherotrites archaeon]
MKIGFIGSEEIVGSIIKSLLDTRMFSPKDIFVCTMNTKIVKLMKSFKVNVFKETFFVIKNSEIVFICVELNDLENIFKEISPLAQGKIFVSVVEGVRIATIQKYIKAPIARVVFSIPVSVKEGMCAVSFSKDFPEKYKRAVTLMLSSCGKYLEVSENEFDTVAILISAGPVFYAYILSCFVEAAIESGLTKAEAFTLANQTFLGSAKLIFNQRAMYDNLVKKSYSDNYVLDAGLEIMRSSNIKKIIKDTISVIVSRRKLIKY